MTTYKNILNLFQSREDVYAECFWNTKAKRYSYKSIKKPVTIALIKKHCTDTNFDGIGVYPIIDNDLTKWVAADFDFHNNQEKAELKPVLKKIFEIAKGIEWEIYLERSKSGNGYHLWTFFSEPIKSWKARKFMMALLEAAGATHLTSMDRLFPSQDKIFIDGKKFGNLIHLPFSAGHITKGTYFIDQTNKKWTNNADDIDNFIENIVQHSSEELNSILDSWNLSKEIDPSFDYETDDTHYEYADNAVEKMMDDPFIKWCIDNPKKVDYYAWFAMITNFLPLGEDGIKAIHDLSARDVNRYDRDYTQKQIIACQGYNPLTYNWIINNTAYKERKSVKYKSPIVAGVERSQIYIPIKEKLGQYFYTEGKKEIRISNFIFIPQKFVSIQDPVTKTLGIERIFDLKTPKKIYKNLAIDSAMIATVKTFDENIMRRSHDCFYLGTQKHLKHIFEFINQTYPTTPTVIGKPCIGLHKNTKTGKWAVLTQTSAWDSIGQVDDLVYYNPSYTKNITFTSQTKIKQNDIEAINEKLYSFNGLEQVATILAWIFALPIKQRLYESHRFRFPVLMIHGQAGSGKTETMRHIIKRFFGDFGSMYIIGDQTNFTFINVFGSSNTFPIYLDEYKPASFGFSTKKLVSQMIRSVYDNTNASRGQKNLTIREYPIIAPTVLCGESGFNEPALVERSIDVFMAKEDSEPGIDAFKALKTLPLTTLGNSYINWTLRLSDEDIYNMYQKNITGKDDRTSHNIAMMKVGLELMGQFFNTYGLTPAIEPLKQQMEIAQMRHIEENGGVASVVDNILEAIFTMKESKLFNGEVITGGEYEGELRLDIRNIYPQFKKWARETDFDYEVIPRLDFQKQLRKMRYFKEYKQMRFDGDLKKCYVLDTKNLIKKDIFQSEKDNDNDIPK